MEMAFADDEIESLCREEKLAKKRLGTNCAQKLQRRLVELINAGHVGELIAGRPHPLKEARVGQFAVDLDGGYRLIFISTTQPPPIKPDGGIDWATVTKITITEIVDYH